MTRYTLKLKILCKKDRFTPGGQFKTSFTPYKNFYSKTIKNRIHIRKIRCSIRNGQGPTPIKM